MLKSGAVWIVSATTGKRMPKAYFAQNKKEPESSFSFRLDAVNFVAFETSCANVIVDDRSVLLFIGNLLHIGEERSSRFAIGVADVVAGRSTLTAHATYSGHI